MLKRTIITILLSIFLVPTLNTAYSADADTGFTKLTTVDLNTFNEYRYRITEQFFELRSRFEIEGSIDKNIALKIGDIAKQGYNYLPDNLANKNLYNRLKTSIERGVKYPDNEGNYTAIIGDIQGYLEDVQIEKITGKVEAFPDSGNAPLTVTFRGNVKEPTGTKIPAHNYIWWMDVGGKRKILSEGRGPSLIHTFEEEGNFSVFLDVVSDHKNAGGYTDVLPFRSREDIEVKEKVASVIIKVNGLSLRQKDELKFTPEEANYGLLFDATSSTPTSGTEFIKTEWQFGNGITEEYQGDPRIERVVYNGEGEYRVKLELRTNEGKTTQREFDIIVHDPIATIKSNLEEGFLGDKFTFSAENQINDDNLTYAWEIIDLEKDEIIFRKTGSLFTYAFIKKGKYNVRLIVREPSSNVPDIDTQIIHINSRAPEASFKSSIPLKSKPNMVLLDATKSYDPDFSDEGKLKFAWVINGQRVQLDNPNYNGSIGYYTFDSIGDHSVVLEVTDPDGITVQKKDKIRVDSILSVEFFAFPRVIQREQRIDFDADSSEAQFYEWDFGDGEVEGGKDSKISHVYKESGVFPVKLEVVDEDDNTNTFTKNVYVGESNAPYAFITLQNSGNSEITFRKEACDGKGAYVVNRVDSIKFSGEESIDITGKNNGLSYSWKLDGDTFYSSSTFRKKFDELGCFPVQLKVKSDKNGKTSVRSIWVQVENIKPTLSSIDVQVVDDSSDPVIVKVNALGAQDRDGVIQSYLWYYYTDIDTEPQDFRATKEGSTTFVLPKITGNYYFVALMKDNNEARITSEEITGSKYFITLAGDNVNTPLVKLKSNKRSVTIGEDIIFTASAENILGQDISKKAKYSWDLDGDGFYEKETSSPITSYKFAYSGEFHSKVKVKYKGFSSTKSITIGVANILKPDFSYLSIGNQFVFFDKSTGTYDAIKWDLGDATKVSKEPTFIHEYSDDASTHFVELEIAEGSKVRTVKKKVVKNLKNFITARKGNLVIFSDPVLDSDTITLEQAENVYLFMRTNHQDTLTYSLDFDIGKDSDLNGGVDDDEDISGTFSGSSSQPVLIDLNKQKKQNVRVVTKNASGSIVDSYDFTIEKLYIDEEIDINTINFKGISDSERVKIEKLKDYVNSLSKEHKLKALMYVQKLQEEWFDNREKTNVILEFENYVTEVDPEGAEYAINLLESLLVEGQEDQSEKSIIFNALKNLLPQTISCDAMEEDLGEQSCYDALVAKLEVIKENSVIDENRALGKQILEVVAEDKTMTNKQKTDFKAILKTFVYGGVQNIPEEEKQEVIEDNEGGSNLFGLIKSIFLWILILLGVFIFISFIYYIYYRIVNKDPNTGFQDFIIDKTSGRKKEKTEKNITEEEDLKDILGSMSEEEDVSKVAKNPIVEEQVPLTPETPVENKKSEEVQKKQEEKADENNQPKAEFTKEEVPDWLKGNFSSEDDTQKDTKEVQEEEQTPPPTGTLLEKGREEDNKEKVENVGTEGKNDKDDSNVPDWLKGSFGDNDAKETPESRDEGVEVSNETKGLETPSTEKVEKVESEGENESEEQKEEEVKNSDGGELPKNEDLEEITKITDDSEEEDKDIPDWLKGSFSKDEEVSEPTKDEPKNGASTDDGENKKPEEDSEPKAESLGKDDNIPDWLKAGFGDNEEKKEGTQEIIEDREEEIKKEEAPKVDEAPVEEIKESEAPKTEVKKKPAPKRKKKSAKKEVEASQEEEKTVDEEKKNKDTKPKKDEPVKEKQEDKKEEKTPRKKKTPVKKDAEDEKKPEEEKPKKAQKDEEKTTDETPKSDSDLWDDGMKIPDWLKTDSDK